MFNIANPLASALPPRHKASDTAPASEIARSSRRVNVGRTAGRCLRIFANACIGAGFRRRCDVPTAHAERAPPVARSRGVRSVDARDQATSGQCSCSVDAVLCRRLRLRGRRGALAGTPVLAADLPSFRTMGDGAQHVLILATDWVSRGTATLRGVGPLGTDPAGALF